MSAVVATLGTSEAVTDDKAPFTAHTLVKVSHSGRPVDGDIAIGSLLARGYWELLVDLEEPVALTAAGNPWHCPPGDNGGRFTDQNASHCESPVTIEHLRLMSELNRISDESGAFSDEWRKANERLRAISSGDQLMHLYTRPNYQVEEIVAEADGDLEVAPGDAGWADPDPADAPADADVSVLGPGADGTITWNMIRTEHERRRFESTPPAEWDKKFAEYGTTDEQRMFLKYASDEDLDRWVEMAPALWETTSGESGPVALGWGGPLDPSDPESVAKSISLALIGNERNNRNIILEGGTPAVLNATAEQQAQLSALSDIELEELWQAHNSRTTYRDQFFPLGTPPTPADGTISYAHLEWEKNRRAVREEIMSSGLLEERRQTAMFRLEKAAHVEVQGLRSEQAQFLMSLSDEDLNAHLEGQSFTAPGVIQTGPESLGWEQRVPLEGQELRDSITVNMIHDEQHRRVRSANPGRMVERTHPEQAEFLATIPDKELFHLNNSLDSRNIPDRFDRDALHPLREDWVLPDLPAIEAERRAESIAHLEQVKANAGIPERIEIEGQGELFDSEAFADPDWSPPVGGDPDDYDQFSPERAQVVANSETALTWADEELSRLTWEQNNLPGGVASKVTGVTPNLDGTSVSGVFIDEEGKTVGRFSRSMSFDDGRYNVTHDHLALGESIQGQGIATAFNQHAENYYVSHGVEAIRLNANIDVGGYAWARNGFEFDHEHGNGDGGIRERIDAMIEEEAEDFWYQGEEAVNDWASANIEPPDLDQDLDTITMEAETHEEMLRELGVDIRMNIHNIPDPPDVNDDEYNIDNDPDGEEWEAAQDQFRGELTEWRDEAYYDLGSAGQQWRGSYEGNYGAAEDLPMAEGVLYNAGITPPDSSDRLQQLMEIRDGDYYSAYELSDSPLGKQIMLGSSWDGVKYLAETDYGGYGQTRPFEEMIQAAVTRKKALLQHGKLTPEQRERVELELWDLEEKSKALVASAEPRPAPPRTLSEDYRRFPMRISEAHDRWVQRMVEEHGHEYEPNPEHEDWNVWWLDMMFEFDPAGPGEGLVAAGNPWHCPPGDNGGRFTDRDASHCDSPVTEEAIERYEIWQSTEPFSDDWYATRQSLRDALSTDPTILGRQLTYFWFPGEKGYDDFMFEPPEPPTIEQLSAKVEALPDDADWDTYEQMADEILTAATGTEDFATAEAAYFLLGDVRYKAGVAGHNDEYRIQEEFADVLMDEAFGHGWIDEESGEWRDPAGPPISPEDLWPEVEGNPIPELRDQQASQHLGFIKDTIGADTLGEPTDEQLQEVADVLAGNIFGAEPAMYVDPDDLLGMLRDGQYVPWSHPKITETNSVTTNRPIIEYVGMGIPEDAPWHERPVYAALVDGSPAEQSGEQSLRYFGGVEVMLKGDVLERSSVTFGDSGSFDPNVRSFPTPIPYNELADADRDRILNATNHREVSYLADPEDHYNERPGWDELQIWGGLRTSDISSVYIQPSSANTVVGRQLMAKLKEAGIPADVADYDWKDDY